MRRVVSKSLYTSYRKCRLLAWLNANKVEDNMSDQSKLSAEEGNEFGLLAQRYFGECIDVSKECDNSISDMIMKTEEYIAEERTNICEAAFSSEKGYCQVDILHRNVKGNYDIVEVKSTSKIKDHYYDDMAFQYHVAKDKVKIDRIYLLHVNKEYRLGDSLTNELFSLVDVTEKVAEKEKDINIEEILNTVNSKECPECRIGKQCKKDWDCPYCEYCIERMNDKEKKILKFEGLTWVQKLRSISAGQLIIPKGKDNLLLSDDKEIINRKEISEFLNEIRFPLYLLDFESVQNVIPKFRGQKPWSQTPFQYSLHIVNSYDDLMSLKNIEHRECLVTSEEGIDPREVVASQLISDIPHDVQIMAYNMSFEKSIIRELAVIFPQYEEKLLSMTGNFIDLIVPFKKQWYYKGIMHGSYSIKTVLPALFPDDDTLNYHNLTEVQNGVQAQITYKKLIAMEDGTEKDELIHNMLKYCSLDTFAMVKVLNVLYDMTGYRR